MMHNNERRTDKLTPGTEFKPATLAESVAEQIWLAIIAGDLEPGERLGEQRWAEALNVSRGPIREAANSLVAQGLIVAYPRKGFFVREFTTKEAADLYDTRIAIERHALRTIFKAGQHQALLGALTAKFEDMRDAASNNNLIDLAVADVAFHRQFMQIAANERLLKFFDDISREYIFLLSRHETFSLCHAQAVEDHMPIMDAVRNRDLTAALDWIAHHFVASGAQVV